MCICVDVYLCSGFLLTRPSPKPYPFVWHTYSDLFFLYSVCCLYFFHVFFLFFSQEIGRRIPNHLLGIPFAHIPLARYPICSVSHLVGIPFASVSNPICSVSHPMCEQLWSYQGGGGRNMVVFFRCIFVCFCLFGGVGGLVAKIDCDWMWHRCQANADKTVHSTKDARRCEETARKHDGVNVLLEPK